MTPAPSTVIPFGGHQQPSTFSIGLHTHRMRLLVAALIACSLSASVFAQGTPPLSEGIPVTVTADGPAAPPPRPSLIGTTPSGARIVLQALDGETIESAARRWASEAGMDRDEDVDLTLRQLVQGLRAAEGASDGLPLTAAGARRTVSLASVHTGGGEQGSERRFRVHMLEGESAEGAARGFLLRMGLPVEENVRSLAARLEEQRLAALENAARAAQPPPPPPAPAPAPSLPPSEGVVLRVTFSDDAARPDAFCTYRFGESLPSVVSAFLDGAGVREPATRAQATASISEGLAALAAQALRGEGATLGRGAAGEADVYTEASVSIPLMAGGDDFLLQLPAGGSLRAASRLCVGVWGGSGCMN